MIVIDASVLANALIDPSSIGQKTRNALMGQQNICAPDCIDVETYSVFRKLWLRKILSDGEFHQAVRVLSELPSQKNLNVRY